jgi:NAD(P)-dependent dehydrogenase (short-subunit alcohol dehydrogenase family)
MPRMTAPGEAPARVVLVAGGGGGIGLAAAQALARAGDHVIVADRDGNLARTAAGGLGANALAVACDVTDEAQVDALIGETVTKLGRIDALVNSAGIGLQKSFIETSAAEWRRVHDVNLFGAFLLARAAARQMVAQGGGGRIVHIASISGNRGSAGRAAYGASKAGLINLTQVMAVELAAHGITVNCVNPGPVETALTRDMHTDATRTGWHRAVPLERYGTVEEIAAAIVFLLSPGASYVTGGALEVVGGFSAAGL